MARSPKIPDEVQTLWRAETILNNARHNLAMTHQVIGSNLRFKRESGKLSLRSMAKLLNISAVYLSDLETGNRQWTDTRINQFIKHLI